MKKIAVIIGAGPAGLTAAYEFLERTDIHPIVLEKNDFVGGISATHNYKNNRIDLGGYRFFTKSDRVMKWWLNFLPLQTAPSKDDILLSDENNNAHNTAMYDPEKNDNVMLQRRRISRIYYNKKFFDYPVSLSLNTVLGLGIWRMILIVLSYFKALVFKRNEKSLEDFFVNRFGYKLYETFFKDYTEKLWGIKCADISAEWGAQRVKGISILAIVKDIFQKIFKIKKGKNIETSLIDGFYYPKFGPGHLWQTVADKIKEKGGDILFNIKITDVVCEGNLVKKICWENDNGEKKEIEPDYVLSSMPVKYLIKLMGNRVNNEVKNIADGLAYRDFRTVGVLVNKLKLKNKTKYNTVNGIVPDTWIYVQEKNVKMGRIQVFNNWSPYMVNDFENTVWLGLEYFCSQGDEIWDAKDKDFIDFAVGELVKMGVVDIEDVLDTCSYKVEKAYPAYFGSYDKFEKIREFVDGFDNLFLIGRNGMHKYNNMDHSVLTAMTAVDNIVHVKNSKDNIWLVNTEKEYHEEKK